MRRRKFLATTGATLELATVGCLGLLETQDVGEPDEPPAVEDPPDAVYVPSHLEGMEMAGTAADGRYRFALTYARPHRFWLLTGDRIREVTPGDDESVHLMVSVWDGETGTTIPASSATVSVTKDGEQIHTGTSLWSMLSQNMGVHFGDNVELAGDGTYTVTLSFGPVSIRRGGSLAGAFTERAEATVSMEYSQDRLADLSSRELEDRKGKQDAVSPMEGSMIPASSVPEPDALPGTVRADGTSGDAQFVVSTMPVPDGIDGDGTYLSVSARTPYNRYPLPFMTLSATLAGASETGFEGDLSPALHPGFGYHYGAVVDNVESGTELSIVVEKPPQISRHEGYETAFLEFSTVELTL